MMLLRKLPLLQKILLAPIVGAICFLAYLTYTCQVTTQNNARLELIRNVLFPELKDANGNVTAPKKIIEALNAAVTSGEKDQIRNTEELANKVRTSLSKIQKNKVIPIEEVKLLTQEFNASFDQAKRLSLSIATGTPPSQSEFTAMAATLQTYKNHLLKFRDASHIPFTTTVDETSSASNRALMAGITIAAVILITCISASLIVARAIKKNVSTVVTSLKDITKGEGDLRQRILQTGEDEVSPQVFWFNTFVEKLQADISRVVESATGIDRTDIPDRNPVKANYRFGCRSDKKTASEKPCAQRNRLPAQERLCGRFPTTWVRLHR